MRPIVGRTDDMLIVRGVNVCPSRVGHVLGRVPELSPHFGLVVCRPDVLDEIEVQAEVTDDYVRSAGAGLLAEGTVVEGDLRDRVTRLIRDTIGCTMAVRLVPPGAAPRSEGGKIQRVTDLRR